MTTRERTDARLFARGDTFQSHDGSGPYRARIRFVDGDTVFLDVWKEDQSKGKACSYGACGRLSMWFLSSPACGWKLLDAAAEVAKGDGHA
jgi:hypothetical protein